MEGCIRPIRVKYVLTHPIQYVSPLLQKLAEQGGIDLEVVYHTDAGAKLYFDPDFGRELSWDQDLLSGYRSRVMQPGAKFDDRLLVSSVGRLAEIINRKQADLVITHGWGAPIYSVATLLALLRSVPLLYRTDIYKYYDSSTYRAHSRTRIALTRLKPWVLRRLFRRIDGFLSIGSWNRDYYLGLGVPPEKIFRAPHTTDFSRASLELAGPGALEAKERALGLDPDSFRVLFSGKLIRRKRPFDVIEAVARVPEREKVEIVFIGDGALKPYLAALARRRKVKAVFPGFINLSELPLYYALGHVLALPSVSEPWGLVVNEAMAMGVPAVVSDRVGAGPDMVVEGETGGTHPTRDVAALAQKLAAIAASPELHRRLSAGALAMAREFRVEQAVAGFMAAIAATVGNRAARRR